MFFDFRRGADRWPECAELVSPEAAEAAIQKLKDKVAKEVPGAKKVNTSSVSGGPAAGTRKMEGF